MPSEKILKEKAGEVDRIAKMLKGAKVIALIDLKELPARQYQKIRKALGEKAEFVVAKNSILKRAFDKAKVGKELSGKMAGPTGLIVTDMNPFELYKIIKKNASKAAAKPGQVAPFDIIVPAGETNIPPGPGLSELKAGKIDARIAAGKVVVGKDSTVAKKGEKILGPVAKALSKLDIMPFTVRMRIPAVLEAGTVYPESVLDINEEQFMSDLGLAYAHALGLSVHIAYTTPENIRILLGMANNKAMNLGVEAGITEKGVIERLLAKAYLQAGGLKTAAKDA